MKNSFSLLVLLGISAAACFVAPAQQKKIYPDRWLYLNSGLQSDKDVEVMSDLIRTAAERKPALAILTDSPDFHLRAARKLKRLGIPVVYLVAPQVWAWRKGRVKVMPRLMDRLLCISPSKRPFSAVTTFR